MPRAEHRDTPYHYRRVHQVKPRGYVTAPPPGKSKLVRAAIKAAQAAVADELVVQRNREVRHAGAADADGAFVRAFKVRAEQSLYVFATGVLQYTFLHPPFHKPVCDWLQAVPPHRKLLLMPRDHAKTTLVARAWPLHLWIQPSETNRYFPGMPGTHTRIMLAGEKEERATDNVRVLKSHLEGNDLLRAWWPHVCWQKPRTESAEWNKTTLILPRGVEFAEPSIRAVGVGAAYTGQHPNVMIKDDITTERAAKSAVEMQTAIEWHKNTRALLSNPETDLEVVSGTYWGAFDLPHVIEADPSVTVNTAWRSVQRDDGTFLWPAKMNLDLMHRLMSDAEFGPRFHLLYRNCVEDTTLCAFDRADLRFFECDGLTLTWSDDPREEAIADAERAAWQRSETIIPDLRGRRLQDEETQELLRLRAYRLRMPG